VVIKKIYKTSEVKEGNKMKYDYLIVGSGLYGAVCAYELNKKGYKVLVVEKRNHIGGNAYTEEIEGINVHKYGAHIFHTSDKEIWEYVNQFADFNNYVNSPVARYKNELYNLPFNMNTFSKLWNDVYTPSDAKRRIDEEKKASYVEEPKNLEEQAINLVGKTIFEKLVKGYTEKQWGKRCNELPSFIIKRLPVRFTFDNNYFNDRYQGIPVGGYTKMIEKMLNGIEVKTSYNYFDHKEELDSCANKIIYTGPIDQYFDYCYGALEYRSVRFENEILDMDNYQGNAVVNYTEYEVPYTRIIEHKHFEFGTQSKTVISKEYSSTWKLGDEPYYPINDDKNSALYAKYKELADKNDKVIFGGRLGQYKYFDMHVVIKEALAEVKNL
jgi:UDP-galactopyranose mutase